MFNKFVPFATAVSIYDIDIAFYKNAGVKTVLADLDNTLDSYKLYKPLPHAFALKEMLEKNNINLVIISNNRGNRVSSYANALKVPYINSARKPFAHKIKKYIIENNLNKSEIIFVGDQMMTDVLAAKGAGLRIVLTNKLVDEDQITTRFNRIFGKRIRKHLYKKNKLTDWRKIYG